MRLWLILAGLVPLLTPAQAQTMYRCGGVFQDRPCDAEGVGAQKRPPSGAGSIPAPNQVSGTAARFASECLRVGEAAQQFAWKREAGATLEKQSAELAATGQLAQHSKTLEAVYQRRGSAPDIRKAIEADCRDEKQRAAELATAVNALRQASPESVGAPQPGNQVPAEAAKTPAHAAAPVTAGAGSYRCKLLKDRRETLTQEARAGGSGSAMDNNRAELRRINQAINDERC